MNEKTRIMFTGRARRH